MSGGGGGLDPHLFSVLYTAAVLAALALLFRLLRYLAARPTLGPPGRPVVSPGRRRAPPSLPGLPKRPDQCGRHHWASPGAVAMGQEASERAGGHSRCALCRSLIVAPGCPKQAEASKTSKTVQPPRPPGAVVGYLVCTDCGMISCDRRRCLKLADRRQRCKASVTFTEEWEMEEEEEEGEEGEQTAQEQAHHWISGVGGPQEECFVCQEASCPTDGEAEDDDDDELKCCWCQRIVHRGCKPRVPSSSVPQCDLGEFRRLLVPSASVLVPTPEAAKAAEGRRRRRRRRGSEGEESRKAIVKPPPWTENGGEEWTPLVVIGNTRAGNNDGAAFLNAFRGILNPAQVVDLGHQRMEDGLHWCKVVSPRRCLLVVAGGDGTIGWTLDTLDSISASSSSAASANDVSFPPPPTICLLPLGTGNDLARTLGYGSGGGVTDVREFLRTMMQKTEETELDRWRVEISALERIAAARGRKKSSPKHIQQKVPIRKPLRTVFLQNYLSVGVDALVTYNFHRTREDSSKRLLPSILSGRLFNKLLFFLYGTKDVLERECRDLDRILELEMDGKVVPLPSIESVVVLNIPCWGAGVRPWELGSNHADFNVPAIDDEFLEVFCVYSSFHIAQMQVGLSEPHRLGHAREVKIRLRGKAPMQADGEPWIQGPSEIAISHHKKVKFLKIVE